MIRSALLSVGTAASMIHGSTEMAQMINKSVLNYALIYEAAGQLLSDDGTISKTAEAKMYNAAAGLQPIADYYMSGQLEKAFMEAELGS
jgi:hypothetical protein